MNTHHQIRKHREMIEVLYTIREFEEKKEQALSLAASCDDGGNKYHPHYQELKASYLRSADIFSGRIEDEKRDYLHLMHELRINPIRKAIRRILASLGELPVLVPKSAFQK